jgi:hypothetical protein
VAIRLTTRCNDLFTKLLSTWLVSETVVNYFVFELRGFEFLLDTISSHKPQSDAKSVDAVIEKVSTVVPTSELEKLMLGSVKQEKAEVKASSE